MFWYKFRRFVFLFIFSVFSLVSLMHRNLYRFQQRVNAARTQFVIFIFFFLLLFYCCGLNHIDCSVDARRLRVCTVFAMQYPIHIVRHTHSLSLSFARSLSLCWCLCVLWPECRSSVRIRAMAERIKQRFTPFYVRCYPYGFRLMNRRIIVLVLGCCRFFFVFKCVCMPVGEEERAHASKKCFISSMSSPPSVGLECVYMNCYAASLLECRSYYCYVAQNDVRSPSIVTAKLFRQCLCANRMALSNTNTNTNEHTWRGEKRIVYFTCDKCTCRWIARQPSVFAEDIQNREGSLLRSTPFVWVWHFPFEKNWIAFTDYGKTAVVLVHTADCVGLTENEWCCVHTRSNGQKLSIEQIKMMVMMMTVTMWL